MERLVEKGICAEFVRFAYVARVIGGGEDDDAQGFEIRVLANPAKDFKAVHAGQIEVKDDKVGQREFVAMGILARGSEVSDGFFAIADNIKRIGDAGLGQRSAEEENVVFAIFDEEYYPLRHTTIWRAFPSMSRTSFGAEPVSTPSLNRESLSASQPGGAYSHMA